MLILMILLLENCIEKYILKSFGSTRAPKAPNPFGRVKGFTRYLVFSFSLDRFLLILEEGENYAYKG